MSDRRSVPTLDRRQLIAGAVATSSLLLTPGLAGADDAVPTLKVATIAPANTPWAKHLRRLKKRVKQETEGRVKMKVYLGGALGDPERLIEKSRKGEVSGWVGPTSALAELIPELAALELPYLFSESSAAVDRLLDAHLRPAVDRLLAGLGLELVSFSTGTYRAVGTRFGPVRGPADARGRTIRVSGRGVHAETWKALGARPQQVAAAQVARRLGGGALDGAEGTPDALIAAMGSLTHLTWTQHSYQPAVAVMNRDVWRSLPARLRAALASEGPEGHGDGAAKRSLVTRARAARVPVHTATPAERAALAEATRGTHRAFKDKHGSTFYKAITKHL